jgi:hypothetical protein
MTTAGGGGTDQGERMKGETQLPWAWRGYYRDRERRKDVNVVFERIKAKG